MLKAQLLVSLRAGIKEVEQDGKKQQVPYAELVVSETGQGVRLLVRTIPTSESSAKDAVILPGLVDEAMRRYGQRIDEIFAVPPFMSNNLTFENDHLKVTYALLWEQALLERSGVVVVELAEAEALARDSQLSGLPATRYLPESQ
jgi:hypothetical protein